jgi:hypothetical protein
MNNNSHDKARLSYVVSVLALVLTTTSIALSALHTSLAHLGPAAFQYHVLCLRLNPYILETSLGWIHVFVVLTCILSIS